MSGQPFGINTNVSSLVANATLNANRDRQNTIFRSLATGLAISRGVDGPAALISSQSLMASLRVLEAESLSIQRTNAVVAVADGALGEVSNLLGEAESLAVATANTAGLSASEREANQIELDSILRTVDRIGRTTYFNGSPLLDGSLSVNLSRGDTLNVQSISSSDLGQTTTSTATFTLADTGSSGDLNLVSGDVATAQDVISAARTEVDTLRGELGSAARFVLEPRLRSLSVAIANTASATSIVRDTDFASATSDLTRLSILTDTGLRAAMIANTSPSRVLGLLTPVLF